jgi:hypothetical protein
VFANGFKIRIEDVFRFVESTGSNKAKFHTDITVEAAKPAIRVIEVHASKCSPII